MKKNILSVIGAATVAAVALKLTTKYVKNAVIKELEDDGYLYDDDDCDDCDECCGCDDCIDDVHHAPVTTVHVIRVERKHDEAKEDTDKAAVENPDADKDEPGKVDSDGASEVAEAKDEPAEEPVEEKLAEEKKNEPDIVVPVKQPAKKDDGKSDLDVHIDEIIDSFAGPNA